MAVTRRATSRSAATSSSTASPTRPAGTVGTDALLMAFALEDAAPKPDLPAGWTELAYVAMPSGAAGAWQFILWGRPDAPVGPYSITWDGSTVFNWWRVVSYHGHDPTNPFRVGAGNPFGAQGSATATNQVAASSITPVDDNCLLAYFASPDGPTTALWTPPAGMDPVDDVANSHFYAEQQLAAAGVATGSKTGQVSANRWNVGSLVAIAPPAIIAAPPSAVVAFTGAAPTVTAAGPDIEVTPPAGNIAFSASAPTVTVATAGQFASDSFTDTPGVALASHSPEVGGPWVKHPSYASGALVVSDANRARANNANPACYYLSAAPTTADYDVEAVIFVASNLSNILVAGRISTGADTMYAARYTLSGGVWQLVRIVAGVVTPIGATFAQALTATQLLTARLSMRGSTIKMFIDGVERASVVDANITATGRAGLRVGSGTSPSNTTGYHYESLTATDADGSITLSPPPGALAFGASNPAVGVVGPDLELAPASGQMVLSASAPTVGEALAPAVGGVGLTASAPTVTLALAAAPLAGAVAWTASAPTIGVTAPPKPVIHVRESPPLRLAHEIVNPAGKRFRWAEDEPDPANVPSGVGFGSTMPGGHDTAQAVLPRKPGIDYGDQTGFSDWRIYGAGGQVVWDGRLERAARASGDQVSISPEGVGWQAHLEDDKTAQFIGIDRDLGRWQGISNARRIVYGNNYNPITDGQVVANQNGDPVIKFEASGHLPGAVGALSASWYDAGPGNLIAGLIFGSSDTLAAMNFTLDAVGSDNDNAGSITSGVGTVSNGTVLGTAYRALPTAKRWTRFAWVYTGGPYTADENQRWRDVKQVAVVGDHGLPLYGDPGAEGLLASDIVAYALGRWAPLLNFTTGPNGTISPSGFVIPHITFPEPTTAKDMVTQAIRFGLPDWAVWDNRTFYLHPRGARGRKWRFRVGPDQLQETGQAMDRVWNGILVRYQDVDGTTKTVGPPGSAAEVHDAALLVTDPLNPANQAGIRRWDLLDMGKVSVAPTAIEVGRIFLEEANRLDRSGQAIAVGYAMDDRGIVRPASQIRAGDGAVFVDAADSSERRVVRVTYDHSTRTASMDLDAPPEGLDALQERLAVELVRLGIG